MKLIRFKTMGGNMSTYLTRVELHEAGADEYRLLHEAMEEKGFKTSIMGDDKVKYHLPTAEYLYESTETTSFVLGIVKGVIETTKIKAKKPKLKAAILIAQSNRFAWSGLEKA